MDLFTLEYCLFVTVKKRCMVEFIHWLVHLIGNEGDQIY